MHSKTSEIRVKIFTPKTRERRCSMQAETGGMMACNNNIYITTSEITMCYYYCMLSSPSFASMLYLALLSLHPSILVLVILAYNRTHTCAFCDMYDAK